MTYTLSIEKTAGHATQYGFHLGTDLQLARTIVQEKMQAFTANQLPIVTMALKLDNKIVDILYPDGIWHND